MKELYKALASFQSDCPTIDKDTKGHGYTYASLPHTMERIKPMLKEHGLMVMQPISGDGQTVTVTTVIVHADSGESVSHDFTLPVQGMMGNTRMSAIQAVGSIVTYMRRYALSSALGIVTDEDTDGADTGRFLTTQEKEDAKPVMDAKTFDKVIAAIQDGDADKAQKAYDKAMNFYKLTIQQKDELAELMKGA